MFNNVLFEQKKEVPNVVQTGKLAFFPDAHG